MLCVSSEKATEEEMSNPFITTEKALVSAHRSGADIAPENTMMAFEFCVENEDFNVDTFEFDLHITKDDKLILLHDDTLDRTTNAVEEFGYEDVKPSTYTYEELSVLNFGENFETPEGEYPYRNLRGEEIPENLRVVLLEDVLNYLQSNGDYTYIIEIKDKGENGFKAADELYRILKEKNLLEKVVFGTFNGDVTKYVDENYPDMLRSSSIVEVVVFYLAAAYNIELNESFYKFDREKEEGEYDFTADKTAVSMMKRCLDKGNVDTLIVFANSPHYSHTSTGQASGSLLYHTCNLPMSNYRKFADYFLTCTQALIDMGFPVKYVSPINEPQWKWGGSYVWQEGCHYETEEMVAVYHIFAEEIIKKSGN